MTSTNSRLSVSICSKNLTGHTTYANMYETAKTAFEQYAQDVRSGNFPNEQEQYYAHIHYAPSKASEKIQFPIYKNFAQKFFVLLC
ncbi:hypothetical protein AGMMS4956_16870 [Bacteroidia bacterium]|nr:hypothetical protein AGMMS4956_16870 [Bacteroidia bacterium]